VVDDPHVGVERGTGPQGDQIPALLGVDQEHPLAATEDAPVPVGIHVAQRPDDLAEAGSLVLTTSRSPGLSTVR
jgi:hypothetical protein